MLHIDDIEEILAQVERAGKADVWEVVRTYRGVRRRPDGDTREVTIELHRRPVVEEYGAATWRVLAEDGEGRRATSDPNSDLQMAIETVPWHDLDGETPGA
jgi:hypothetical protein